MTTDIWVFPLEPLDNRYTKQWFDEIPRLLQQELDNLASSNTCFQAIGKQTSKDTTAGAFLDFSDTNYWKSTQLADFVKSYQVGHVANDAKILFTDFWNPALIQVAYMRDLLGTDWQIHGIAHAGAYDPTDILGIKMRPEWPHDFERSLFYASDVTYFASNFHRQMFLTNLCIPTAYHDRAVLSGQPHQAIIDHMESISIPTDKTTDVIWPHRYNEDKQPEIAEDLANEFNLLITQKHNFTKDEFYNELANSKIIFSCALHENLGISIMEAVLTGTIPLLPDRCSYSEMYLDEFKYPSKWTSNYENFVHYKPQLVAKMQSMIDNFDTYADLMEQQKAILKQNYLSADVMVKCLTK